MKREKIGCVVVAAGKGERSGLEYNKVFHKINGKSVLSMCLANLSGSGMIDEIALVLSDGDRDAYRMLTEQEGACSIVKKIARGGKTRRESVFSGLTALDEDTDIVLIHDGARPFVTKEIIENVISDARAFGSGVISTKVTDTIKIVDEEGYAFETPDRSMLRAVQTPQAFRFQEILKCHREASEGQAATDDAMLYERVFGKVKLTQAESAGENRKLTLPEDFKALERKKTMIPRVGTGYDVHRLSEGRKLILCGVEIPYEKGLLGHSDADVALHALIDAMLGACALGDIGKLFPDHDMKFKDISSMLLLKEANRVIRENGFRITSTDLTIVCQRPKLAGYIQIMRENIANVLSLPVSCVSVKATTTEKLGFEGEGLGISAQSVAVAVYEGEEA